MYGFQLTATVAGLKFLVPLVFEQLVRLEGWHPRIETKITLARFDYNIAMEKYNKYLLCRLIRLKKDTVCFLMFFII